MTGGVFGALLITGEYSSGTIRTTLAATPKRPLLLAAKIGVTAVLTMVFCELLELRRRSSSARPSFPAEVPRRRAWLVRARSGLWS